MRLGSGTVVGCSAVQHHRRSNANAKAGRGEAGIRKTSYAGNSAGRGGGRVKLEHVSKAQGWLFSPVGHNG